MLSPDKLPLLSSRIQKRIQALKLHDESEYLKIIELDVEGHELVNLIDVVSTNVTHFYREPAHFVALRQILEHWKSEGRSEVKIWCAAASSGEEPYTIAFESCEVLGPSKVRILASDICTTVLKRAIRGVYSRAGVEKIPDHIRKKYMTHSTQGEEEMWAVRPEIGSRILFKKLNLIDIPYPLRGPLDIIFCRNVMIYFDLPTRAKIVHEFSKLLRPGGYLFLSHSESLLGIEHSFEKLDASIFQKE